MALYSVRVEYVVSGNIMVEANNEEEAFDIANDESNPFALEDVENKEYMMGSWQADSCSIVEIK